MSKWIALFAAVMLVVGGTFALSSNAAEEKDKKPRSIKEVMKNHKGGKKSLRAKVLAGQASEEEQKALLAAYTDLAKNKPPKGDAEAWKKRTAAIVKAATALVKGDKKAAKVLSKATNCGACHKAHKA